jgi:hypothetical protein
MKETPGSADALEGVSGGSSERKSEGQPGAETAAENGKHPAKGVVHSITGTTTPKTENVIRSITGTTTPKTENVIRKLCVGVGPTPSWQGRPASAPPVASLPAFGASPASSRISASRPLRRSITRQGTGPRHPPVRAFLPQHPDHVMETEGEFALPLDTHRPTVRRLEAVRCFRAPEPTSRDMLTKRDFLNMLPATR